ncbi:MAG TPA: hypothetical protein DCL41_09500 [Bdellovibrionales bacterium]|nr:hypothetical protein [Pseudobdellovibrionaceae bacterium]HAG92096.1 hypothetical protein [Bdellovibrionales bacterium]|tara:strand:+ start:1813 stop:2745 length:933 start_codon:yes stop_codon:yes gene_type:complete
MELIHDQIKIVVSGKIQSNPVNFAILPYKHKLAQDWVAEILRLQNEEVPVLEKNRIYSLNDNWSNSKIFQEIEKCYEIINQWKPIFENIEFNGPSQELMNRLHLQFERMIGLDKSRSEIFEQAPERVKKAIIDFNILIHRHECYERNADKADYGRIVVTFQNKNRRPIENEDFKRFTHKYQAGEVVLNYCHVGKPLLDVILDEDNHVSPENILPQSEWCGDFSIFFNRGPLFRKDLNEKVDLFWKKNLEKMNNLGFFRDDPKLAFGSLPVGILQENPMELKKRIYGLTEICSVRVCMTNPGESKNDFVQT